jgi:hypothetical protein
MKLRRTDKIAAGCAAFACIATVVFYEFWPYATVWGYLIVWLVITVVAYEAVIKSKARETIVNRQDRD